MHAIASVVDDPSTHRQAYDQHLNMILGDVEETITTFEFDPETYEEIIKVATILVPHPAPNPMELNHIHRVPR